MLIYPSAAKLKSHPILPPLMDEQRLERIIQEQQFGDMKIGVKQTDVAPVGGAEDLAKGLSGFAERIVLSFSDTYDILLPENKDRGLSVCKLFDNWHERSGFSRFTKRGVVEFAVEEKLQYILANYLHDASEYFPDGAARLISQPEILTLDIKRRRMAPEKADGEFTLPFLRKRIFFSGSEGDPELPASKIEKVRSLNFPYKGGELVVSGTAKVSYKVPAFLADNNFWKGLTYDTNPYWILGQ